MCDTLVVVRPDRVWFAKNSDRDPNEAQVLDWQPRKTHKAGAPLRCTWIDIPQVAETHAVLLSRPFWCWGAEMGANEHGLVIGNEAVFTRLAVAKTGLTGMDLVRLALERAATARQALDVLRDLLAAHGQGGGAGHEDRGFRYHNSFLLADPREAWVLETAGPHWVVEPVTGARSISNGLTIEPFATRYRDRLKTRVAGAERRRACTTARAGAAEGLGDLVAALRDHGSAPEAGPGSAPAMEPDARGGPPRYTWLTGGLDAPCVHAGGLVAASQTTQSWVAELTPAGATHFVTGTAAPCTSLFFPVSITERLSAKDLGPTPTDRFDPATLWWRHEQLHRHVVRDPARVPEALWARRDHLEATWLTAPPAPEKALAEARRWREDALMTVAALPEAPFADRRPRRVRRYWRKRDRRAGFTLDI